MNAPVLSAAIRQAAALAALAAIPAVGGWALKTQAPPPAAIASADGMLDPKAAAALGDAALWVDARRRDEFERGHIPGAALLNEDDWDALFPEVIQSWTPARKVIVYCDGGACQSSKQVAARLRDAGITPVYVLRGGWPEWTREMEAPAK